ncbi:MAG: hypothetical protein KJO41_05655 [Bacteroidia bacterium]|nr:hypothetical protein [Bacteroidia bacterium]MBT8278468.1 hypothetical protein [Bacteroidia bacterium]NND24611.1 hypothetical protein [Flavobacteriaceae bacterium]NNK61287.1 hypothetical protein [Flavobacteriaceae bacterium]NNL31847.1 hypothetical protein [Flavobacteriaceae bacterium]
MGKTINRIVDFIHHKGMSVRQFDISIGAANGYTLRMEKNNASVGSDVIERIVKKYPKINLVWLITGKGNMLLEDEIPKKAVQKIDVEAFINKKLNEKWSEEKKALLDEIIKEIKEIKN